MRKNILLLPFLIVIALYSGFWTNCTRLSDLFYFSEFDLRLRIIEAINNDEGIPLLIVRIFHNKVIGFILDVYRHILHFWDVNFLVWLISFLGIFSFVYGLYLLRFKRKRKLIGVLFLTLASLQFLEVIIKFDFLYKWKFFILLFLYSSISLVGLSEFIKRNSFRISISLIMILFLLSIWWMNFFSENPYCSV